MNTLETDIEVGADGSVRLLAPLPAWLRPGRNHVLLVMADGNHLPEPRVPMVGIEKTANICGGDACIASTRIPVWALEQSRRLGFTDDALLENYPTLKREDLDAAWAYVLIHGAEIDAAIRENDEA